MGGWLHRVGEPRGFVPARPVPVREGPHPDFSLLWMRWRDSTDPYHLDGFAMSLGVDTDALRSLGCAWSGRAWAFPMRDAGRKITGIRLRNDSGDKWAVTGSKQGLFIPDEKPDSTLYVLEGPTDAAAALSLGLFAIGRPSCMGCEEYVKAFVRINRISRTIIVTDNDAPGLRGASKLQNALPVMNVCWSPPCKDLREFVRMGGSRQLLESMVKDLVWQRPFSNAPTP